MENTSADNDLIESTFLTEILTDEYEDIKNALINKMGYWQRLSLKILGITTLGNIRLQVWREPLCFYAFYCSKHGLQVSYPRGWKKELICPQCIEESFCE